MNKIPERNHIVDAKSACFAGLFKAGAGYTSLTPSQNAKMTICEFLTKLGYEDIAAHYGSISDSPAEAASNNA